MNDNEMNEMIKKAQSMIQNNQIPEDIKALINNLQSSNKGNISQVNTNNNSSTYNNNFYNYNKSNKAFNSDNNLKNNYNNQNNNSYNYKYNSSSNFSNKNNFSNQNNNFSSNAQNQNNDFNSNNSKSYPNTNNETTSSDQLNDIFSNIDMATLMKIQNIMSKMKNNDNDDMSRLLLSLKPYLRDEKKGKIDDYIKLIKMGKMTQILESLGGDKK